MLRSRTALLVLALIATPLALAGCSSAATSLAGGSSAGSSSGSAGSVSSGSSSAASAGPSVARPADMCALLSTAEATTALGTDIATTYEAEHTACNYDGEDESFSTQLAPTEIGSFATAVKLLELDIDATHPISGVGDQAAGNAKGIAFRKGSVIIDIQIDMGTDHTTEDQVIAMAKIMSSHLG
jgi:hypothetical protein